MIWEFQQRNVIDCATQVAETFFRWAELSWTLNKRRANALHNVLSETLCAFVSKPVGDWLDKQRPATIAAHGHPISHPRSPPSLSLSLLRAHITRSEISAVQALPTELRSSSPRVPCQANLYKNTSSKRESAAEGRVGVFKETTQPKSHKWKREKVSLLLAYIIFFSQLFYYKVYRTQIKLFMFVNIFFTDKSQRVQKNCEKWKYN